MQLQHLEREGACVIVTGGDDLYRLDGSNAKRLHPAVFRIACCHRIAFGPPFGVASLLFRFHGDWVVATTIAQPDGLPVPNHVTLDLLFSATLMEADAPLMDGVAAPTFDTLIAEAGLPLERSIDVPRVQHSIQSGI